MKFAKVKKEFLFAASRTLLSQALLWHPAVSFHPREDDRTFPASSRANTRTAAGRRKKFLNQRAETGRATAPSKIMLGQPA